MSKVLKNLKRETRILGLDKCNPLATTGAIVRGGLFLDGVVRFPANTLPEHLAELVKHSKYFPELRLIMTHERNESLDMNPLYKSTRLPVIRIISQGSTRAHIPSAGRGDNPVREWIVIGMDQEMVEQTRALTHVRGVLPEPVRIAHLLANLHIFGKLRQDKG